MKGGLAQISVTGDELLLLSAYLRRSAVHLRNLRQNRPYSLSAIDLVRRISGGLNVRNTGWQHVTLTFRPTALTQITQMKSGLAQIGVTGDE
jgi:hypothetical protein